LLSTPQRNAIRRLAESNPLFSCTHPIPLSAEAKRGDYVILFWLIASALQGFFFVNLPKTDHKIILPHYFIIFDGEFFFFSPEVPIK
jgi:hypothetical protein